MVAGFQNDPSVTQQEAGFGFNNFMWTMSNQDNIAATPSGTQANSTKLLMMLNRVTTVASPGDGVVLPPALPGVEICVINAHPSNLMTVFGNVSDTLINNVAAATGIQQLPMSIGYYVCLKPGVWHAPGVGVGTNGNFPTYSTQTGITASATQTQIAATLLTASQCQISTCATLHNAVRLPPAVAGMEVTVVNNGAQNADTWPSSQAQGGVSGGDTILPSAQNAALPSIPAAGTVTIFYCFVTGIWVTK
jgi:hypothetical protein